MDISPSRPMRETLEYLHSRLDKRAHWAPPGHRRGAPRVYAYCGSMKQLKKYADKLPTCRPFYATLDVFNHLSPELTDDALVQWRIHGKNAPQPGDLFYAFSIPHRDWIGGGTLYREEEETVALLERGRSRDFARFSEDAHGLILVFATGAILR